MKKIYLDNASTSFPKPKKVAESVFYYMTEQGSNINRGCYDDAYAVEEVVFETRQMLCELFHGENCKNVVFTKNVTESINIVLKGFLKSGDHVLVSSVEHNAVMRPLVREGLLWLQDKGLDEIRKHELKLTGQFLDGLSNLENQKKIRIIGKRDCRNRLGVVSIQTLQKELSQAAFELDNTYGIMTRVGLHCAPSAHKILHTYPVGTIRFSFGYWNTEEEITYALHAVEEICHGL